MRPAHVIEIQTPKKFLLNGLWFGPTKPKKAIIWVHGLSSSAFTKLGIVEKLVDANTAVMTFNNRGHDAVTRVLRLAKKGKTRKVLAGGAHEVFTDCMDDIQGAVNFAKKRGAKQVFLAGHSTGSQKSVYFATRKGNEKKIVGVILLAPMSDYAGAKHADEKGRLAKLTKAARVLVKKGKKNEIVPGTWEDAQRFLSLYTPESTEEIFSYIDPVKKPKIYESLSVPTLVLLAEKDEYADRSADRIEAWFVKHSHSTRFESVIIPEVEHSFQGAERQVARRIKSFVHLLNVPY